MFIAAQASVAAFVGSSFFWMTRLRALSKLAQKLSSWGTCPGKPVATASPNFCVIGSVISIVVSAGMWPAVSTKTCSFSVLIISSEGDREVGFSRWC